MTELERALKAWAKGNKRGKLGSFVFATDHVYHDGVIMCIRVKSLEGRFSILAYEPSRLTLSRPFCGMRVAYSSRTHIIAVENSLKLMHSLVERSNKNWRGISREELSTYSQTIIILNDFSCAHDLNWRFPLTDETDHVLVGARLLLKGKAEAICRFPKPFNSWGKDHLIFDKFDEAVLFKMKNSGVELFDLS